MTAGGMDVCQAVAIPDIRVLPARVGVRRSAELHIEVIAPEPLVGSTVVSGRLGLIRRWHVPPTFPRNALGVSRKWYN
ncbi:hypothetical protein Mth01_17740 [Sphaerimonospora thailandensis]|uniref:Uncharacterized protein n=1 Tax=Sphaerimonospora thailandensis TaxID=795644 RepID=A0A8J3R5C1_9ACTN|nr:hypothetical protein Mth01_17740 [Sphaerimonospora thailandensis]